MGRFLEEVSLFDKCNPQNLNDFLKMNIQMKYFFKTALKCVILRDLEELRKRKFCSLDIIYIDSNDLGND